MQSLVLTTNSGSHRWSFCTGWLVLTIGKPQIKVCRLQDDWIVYLLIIALIRTRGCYKTLRRQLGMGNHPWQGTKPEVGLWFLMWKHFAVCRYRHMHHMYIHLLAHTETVLHWHTNAHTHWHTCHTHTDTCMSHTLTHIYTHTHSHKHKHTHAHLSLIHIWRCRRVTVCRSRWSPYH